MSLDATARSDRAAMAPVREQWIMAKANTIISAALSSCLVAIGCGEASDVETRSAQLPIVAMNAAGEEFLAGTYEAETGKVWLVARVLSGIAESIGTTGYVPVLDYAGKVSSELELAAGVAYTEVDLTAGATLVIAAEQPHAPTVVIGELRLYDAAWVQTIPESAAQTSFGACPEMQDVGPPVTGGGPP